MRPTTAVRQGTGIHVQGVQTAILLIWNRHGVHGSGRATTERSVETDWTGAVNHGQMHAQGLQLPGQRVGRTFLDGRLHIQQVATRSSGRSYPLLPNARQESGHDWPTCHPTKGFRTHRNLHYKVERQGVRRKRLRLYPEQQGLPHMQPRKWDHGQDPERNVDGMLGLRATNWNWPYRLLGRRRRYVRQRHR